MSDAKQIRCVWESGTATYIASPPERYTDTCDGRYFFVENDIVKNYQFKYCPYCGLPVFQKEIPLYVLPSVRVEFGTTDFFFGGGGDSDE